MSEHLFRHDSTPRTEEPLDARSASLNALHDSFSWMQFVDPTTKEDLRDLSVHDAWVLNSARDALKKIDVRHGKNTFIREWDDPNSGQKILLEEGVPVDGIIDWLRRLNHDEELSGSDALQERFNRNVVISTLERYSCPFVALCPDEEVFEARVALEKSFIENDDRNTGNDEKNYNLAKLTLENRKEFLLPSSRISVEESSKRVLRSLITGNNTIEFASSQKNSEKPKALPKQALATTALTWFPTTVLVDIFSQDTLMKSAGTGAAIAISAAFAHDIKKKNSDNEDEKVSHSETVGNFLKIGALPVAANIYGPDATLALVNSEQVESLGEDAVAYAKLALLWGFYKIAPRSIGTVKGPLLRTGKNYISSKIKSNHPEYVPFTVKDEETPLQQSRRATNDIFNLLTDLHPFANLLQGRVPKKLVPHKEEVKEIDQLLLRISKNRYLKDADDATLAFMQYDVLYSFVRFVGKINASKLSNAKLQSVKQAENAVLTTMQNLDPLALSRLEDPSKTFHLNEEEKTRFNEAIIDGHGMAYLLSLNETRPESAIRKHDTEDDLVALKKSILTKSSKNEVDLLADIKRLRRISVNDNVASVIEKRIDKKKK